jgi:hypothetical protein
MGEALHKSGGKGGEAVNCTEMAKCAMLGFI